MEKRETKTAPASSLTQDVDCSVSNRPSTRSNRLTSSDEALRPAKLAGVDVNGDGRPKR